jgi:hypothetical protein
VIRASVARALLAAALVLPAAACGQGSCSFPPVKQSPTDGIVVSVTATGLTDVQNFTLRQNDGSQVVFQVGVLDDPTVFPAGHLKEHQASGSPVRVWFATTPDRTLVAFHLEDALGPAPSTTAITFSCG